MNLMLADMINYILIGVEGIIYIILAETFFTPRVKRHFTACIWLIALVLEYLVLRIVYAWSIKPLVLVIFFMLVIMTGYDSTWLSALFCSVASLSFVNLVDVLVIITFSATTGKSFEMLARTPELYLILSFISKFATIFLAVLVRAFAQKLLLGKPQHWAYHLSCCIYPASALICAICLFLAVQRSPNISTLLLSCMLFLLFTDIGSVFLLGYLETQRAELTQNLLLQQELDSAIVNLSAARQSYENERKLTHDFQNQMAVLKGMLEKGNGNNDALTYIAQVFQRTGSESLSVTTNRTAVDVLLDLKYQSAKERNITFRFRLDDLSAFPIPDNALVVLLSNLLDNAIEACEKLPEDAEKTIIVKMQVQPEECIIYVKNSAITTQNAKVSIFKTTKANASQHGFGMKNVAAIVAQYNGMFTANQEQGWFAFAASFPGVMR